MASLLVASTSSNALELKLGVGYSLGDYYQPAYNYVIAGGERYPVEADTSYTNSRWIGRVILNHNFKLNNTFSIDAYLEHTSLLLRSDPAANGSVDINGTNVIGTNLVYKFF